MATTGILNSELAKIRRVRDACRELLQIRADHPELAAEYLFLDSEHWERIGQLAELDLDSLYREVC